MKTQILSRCMTEDGVDAATLVFRTLHVGFPGVPVDYTFAAATDALADAVVARIPPEVTFRRVPKADHPGWIENLVHTEQEPFFICDTDMVFHSAFPVEEVAQFTLAGEHVPYFTDPYTGCLTASRLHTCLLYFDPVRVRIAISRFMACIRRTHLAPVANLFQPLVLPTDPFLPARFDDCCSLLHRAIGGDRFSVDALATFDHLHAGTWVDELETALPGLKAFHAEVYADPTKARGWREKQKQFYVEHA